MVLGGGSGGRPTKVLLARADLHPSESKGANAHLHLIFLLDHRGHI
jgi:hypothetical protein